MQFKQLNDGIGKLSINLLKELADGKGNTVLSAYGISAALGICMFGAKGELSEASISRESLIAASIPERQSD